MVYVTFPLFRPVSPLHNINRLFQTNTIADAIVSILMDLKTNIQVLAIEQSVKRPLERETELT